MRSLHFTSLNDGSCLPTNGKSFIFPCIAPSTQGCVFDGNPCPRNLTSSRNYQVDIEIIVSLEAGIRYKFNVWSRRLRNKTQSNATTYLNPSSVVQHLPILRSPLLTISGRWRGAVTLDFTDSTIEALFASLKATAAFLSFRILKVISMST